MNKEGIANGQKLKIRETTTSRPFSETGGVPLDLVDLWYAQ